MKVLVCGSRDFNDYKKMKEVLDSEYHYGRGFSTVIEGEARGADLLARRYAEEHGLDVLPFPADWDTHGKAAGPIRNAQMLREGKPDYVIAFRGPNSRGTQNMIDQARKARVPVDVIEI